MSITRYDDIERSALAQLNGTQANRIDARIQAGANYAMMAELDAGNPLNTAEIGTGIIRAVRGVMAMAQNNWRAAYGKERGDELAAALRQQLAATLLARGVDDDVDNGLHELPPVSLAPGGHA